MAGDRIVLEQAARGLPSAVWKHYEAYRQVLYVRGMPAKSYERQHGILNTINRAISSGSCLQAEYQPPGKDPQSRQLEPYAVVFYQGSLYIVAAAHEIPPGQDRIRHSSSTDSCGPRRWHRIFNGRPIFNLEAHLAQGVGIFSGGKARDFRIRISQHGARWVLEDPWHADAKGGAASRRQRIVTVPAHHDLEIIPRVLALGSEAEVLAPASCRQAMGAIVRQLAERYGRE